MSKHAYLIIAHNQFNILEYLIKLLDDERNDIYIHIDKKIKDFDFKRFENIVKKSNIYFTQRTSVTWGGYSQINSEIILLRESVKKNYKYYHLLSGVDLPIKSQNFIHNFFEEHDGKEFVHFDKPFFDDKFIKRIKYYYIFQEYIGRKRTLLSNILRIFQEISLFIQSKISIDRINKNEVYFQKGANWFSITNELANYIVNQEEKIKKIYKYTKCADEIFLQTIISNSKFKNNIFYNGYDDNYISCIRYIDWERGDPYVFRKHDFNDLISSKYIFARKFDYNEDEEIVKKIHEYLVIDM